MAVVKVPVKPETLQWAMDWVGLSKDILAKRIKVKPEKVEAWLNGHDRPTHSQALRLARSLRLSLGALLLPPPEVTLPLADFRRGPARGRAPSPELLEAVYDALRKRDWWRERKKEILPFVGSGQGKSPHAVADAIRGTIPLKEIQKKALSWSSFLKDFVEEVEKVGVLVCRRGYAAANTQRLYDPQEFSGFTVVDPIAPVIFINARDPISRQIFTLAHELAHVWVGEGGVDGLLEDTAPDELEAFVDQAAAELLMPREEFVQVWNATWEPIRAAENAAKHFWVSRWAALRKALDLELITLNMYQIAVDTLIKEGKARERERAEGGNFWRTLEAQNSPTFVREVWRAAQEGELDLKEVAYLLNLSLPTALEFLERGFSVSA